jgi:hypothetical protein
MGKYGKIKFLLHLIGGISTILTGIAAFLAYTTNY